MVLLVNYPAYANDSGNGQSGTAIDAAWLDQQKASIEDQVHSTTNPTIKPKATTDEVVAARGSMASLDARLDAALNEDGTPKPQAGVITGTQYQAGLGAKNVILNGNFDRWSNGFSSDPDYWVNTGLALAGVVQCGPGAGLSDITTFGAGRFCARLSRAPGVDGSLLQTLISTADFVTAANVKGQKVSAACKGKTGIANQLRITFDDGATTTSSSYHTGGGSEEHLSVTHTISNSATKLELKLEVKNSNGDVYVGGVIATFTQLAPSDWQPLADPPASHRVLYLQYATPVGNVGGGEDDLMSFTMPAGTLNYNGRMLRITAWGTFAANVNSKLINAYIGATTVGVGPANVVNLANHRWKMVIEAVRFSSATGTTGMLYTRANNIEANDAMTMRNSGLSEIFANPLVIKFTGTGVADNDIVQTGMLVELLN